MFNTEEFADALQRLRKRSGLTQAELAKKIGVSMMTIRRWEWGQSIPRISDMQKLCEFLKCSEQDFTSYVEVKPELPFTCELRLSHDGTIGFDFRDMYVTSRSDIEFYLSQIRKELEIAYTAQISRGVIKEVNFA